MSILQLKLIRRCLFCSYFAAKIDPEMSILQLIMHRGQQMASTSHCSTILWLMALMATVNLS